MSGSHVGEMSMALTQHVKRQRERGTRGWESVEKRGGGQRSDEESSLRAGKKSRSSLMPL